MFFNAAVIAMFTFTPDFLKHTGLTVSAAGFATSAVMWPALGLSPSVGYFMDRIGFKKTIIAIGGLATAVLIMLIPSAAGNLMLLLILFGVVQTFVPAPVFALVPDITRQENLGLGYGIISTFLHLGITLGPATAGLVRDITGSYNTSYTLMAGFAIITTLAMVALYLNKK